MCAGMFVNQEAACKGQIVDSINLVLKNLVGDTLLQVHLHAKFHMYMSYS